MAVDSLILAANPGSSSRKYALYKKQKCLGLLQFEHVEGGRISTSLTINENKKIIDLSIKRLDEAPKAIVKVFKNEGLIKNVSQIQKIGLRVVAPSGYFLQDRILNEETFAKLEAMETQAPLHIKATLNETRNLKKYFKKASIILISDSAFHASKPDFTWNYAIRLEDADRFEIKRYGYHGISVESVVERLKSLKKLPSKLIVCHLGSGASITAVKDGKSFDNTMGYSPLEGLVMATRSGNIDTVAALTLKKALKLNDKRFEEYLNNRCGLRGISGTSADIRELVKSEASGDYRAKLALEMYVYEIRQAIGQMAASLNGVDALVFTGTVGTRSTIIRERIVDKLTFLGFGLDKEMNNRTVEPFKVIKINLRGRLQSIYVMTTDEELEIVKKINRFKIN